jgi:hypothetical protein
MPLIEEGHSLRAGFVHPLLIQSFKVRMMDFYAKVLKFQMS